MQSLEDQATIELQREPAVWKAYRRAQSEAEARLEETLHLDLLDISVMDLVGGDAGDHVHSMTHLVATTLRDMIASTAVDNEHLLELNEAYLPYADAMMAGLGSFWVVGERFVCLPLPRIALADGMLINDGSPAAVWPNGQAYANGDEGLIPVLQSVEW